MTVRQWLRSKAVDPLLSMARAGASSPRTLARSFGVGFSVGLCPVIGLPMPILFLMLAASKFFSSSSSSSFSFSFSPLSGTAAVSLINAPALLVGNAVSLPAQLLMLGPYLRAGRFLRDAFGDGGRGTGTVVVGGVSSSSSSSSSFSSTTATTPGALLVAAAKEHAKRSVPAALLVWALSAPLVACGIAAALEPWLERAVALSSSSSSSSRSHPQHNRVSAADVELAPLAAAAAAAPT